MKRIIFSLFVLLGIVSASYADYFVGLKFNMGVNGGTDVYSDTTSSDFSYNLGLSPSFGWFFSDKDLFGIRTSATFSNDQNTTDTVSTNEASIDDVLAGIVPSSSVVSTDTIKRKLILTCTPFYRREIKRFDSFLNGRVSLWGEVKLGYKQTLNFNDSGLVNPQTYGITYKVHPVLVFKINDSTTIDTSLDILSLYGSFDWSTRDSYTSFSYSSNLASFSAISVLNSVISFGIIKRIDPQQRKTRKHIVSEAKEE